MNRSLLATALTSLLCFVPGCTQSEAASAAGTYVVDVKPTVDGIIAQQPGGKDLPAEQRSEMDKMLTASFGKNVMTLKADQTFETNAEMSIAGGAPTTSTSKGTWAIEGSKITLNITHEDGKESASTQTGTYDNGRLKIEADKNGRKATIHFVKQDKAE